MISSGALLLSTVLVMLLLILMAHVATAQECKITVTQVSSAGVFDTTMVNKILQMHNEARRSVSTAKMPLLTWNDDLADNMLKFLQSCQPAGQHSNQQQWRQNRFDFQYIGENLGNTAATGGSASDMPTFVQLWLDEEKGWTYEKAPCNKQATCGTCAAGKVCGHWTQAVWAGSTAIGCAWYTGCSGGGYRVGCMYGEGGNLWDEAPYVEESSCALKPLCSATVPAATATLQQSCEGCVASGTPEPTCPPTTTKSGGGGGGPGSPDGGAGGNSSANTNSTKDGDDDGPSGGAIAAAVICSLLGVALIIGAVFYFVKIRKSSDSEDGNSSSKSQEGMTSLQHKFENADPELEQDLLGANNGGSAQPSASPGVSVEI